MYQSKNIQLKNIDKKLTILFIISVTRIMPLNTRFKKLHVRKRNYLKRPKKNMENNPLGEHFLKYFQEYSQQNNSRELPIEIETTNNSSKPVCLLSKQYNLRCINKNLVLALHTERSNSIHDTISDAACATHTKIRPADSFAAFAKHSTSYERPVLASRSCDALSAYSVV